MEPRKVTAELTPLELLKLAYQRERLTLQELRERMATLGVAASVGHLSEILSGKTPLADVREDVLFALLVSLKVKRLADAGLEPAEAPITWLALAGYSVHGWPGDEDDSRLPERSMGRKIRVPRDGLRRSDVAAATALTA